MIALLIVFAPVGLAALDRFAPDLRHNFTILNQLRYPIAIVILIGGLQLCHRILPAKRLKTLDVLPGVLLTVIVWIALASAFSAYLVNFNSFASTYASLSGLFAAMFFLYLAALVLILGGEVNRVLQAHRTLRSAPKGEERDVSP